MARASNASQKSATSSSPKKQKPASSTSRKVKKPSSSGAASGGPASSAAAAAVTAEDKKKTKSPRKAPAQGSELWEFDRIHDHRYTVKPGETFRPNKHVEFLTHWIGKDPKGNPWKPTWEPLANFDDSPENLADYLNKEKWLKSHIKL